MRRTRSGMLCVFAECEVCGWQSESRNAMGNAARHHDATGHYVQVEQTIGVGFGDRATERQNAAAR